MPLILKETHSNGSTVCIWDITETEDELRSAYESLEIDSGEQDKVLEYKIARKRMQWYASRILSSQLIKDFTGVYYDQFGAPHLNESDICVSYSHSYDKVALIFHDEFEVGVDIQRKDDKLKRIADKFLNDDERGRYTKNGQDLKELHLLWGAKEAVFKIHKHHLPFKDIRCQEFTPVQEGELIAEAHRFDGVHKHDLTFKILEDYVFIHTCYEEA